MTLLRKGYRDAHDRVYSARGAASEYACVACSGPARDWAFTYPETYQVCPDTGAKYSDNIYDYQPMCRKCHVAMDLSKDHELLARRVNGCKKSGSRPKSKEHLQAIWESRRADEEGMRTHSALHSSLMSSVNRTRVRCATCGMESNPGNIAKHQAAKAHSGLEVV